MREKYLPFARTQHAVYTKKAKKCVQTLLRRYYDEETECWIWWNTDVDPNVWQYWYEGISSDYGDYGWMEHDDTGWYIEASRGNWIELPSRYDTGNLWYIED